MAEKIVQPKVKNADGSYDELVFTNAIRINGINLLRDENGVLKADGIIIPQKELIPIEGKVDYNQSQIMGFLNSNITIKEDDVLEIYLGIYNSLGVRYGSVIGKIRINRSPNISKIYFIANGSGLPEGKNKIISVSFIFISDTSLSVFFDNETDDDLTDEYIYIDKIYKIIE